MGYACPVCEDPQADAGHLANHLAFTAMLGDDDHESWLENHAPDWNEMGEVELADVVADTVEETEFPQMFEDTAGGLAEPSEAPEERSGALFDEDHEHADHDHAPDPGGVVDTSGPVDEETKAVLEEAREMTQQMLEDESEDSDAEDETE